ncbi:transporter [Streptacidiphilus sp. N1-12]|uniref:Transporter n=2 Tax=Streptacidiphilus alkalitolerans TaxID=3342712 RepID=A0ABV6W910_9ACTN
MSAPTLRVVPLRVNPPRPARIPLPTLVGLALHRQRTALTVAGLGLGALALWTLRTVHSLDGARAGLASAGCTIRSAPVECALAHERVDSALQSVQQLQLALVAVPLLVGALLGAPLVAREFEQGTYRLVWTQSVSRQRWLTGQLCATGGAVALIGAACAALGTLLRQAATPALSFGSKGFEALPYNAFGPVLAVATVLAFAVGVLCGLGWRRTVPPIATTVAGYAALIAGFTWLRRFLLPGLTRYPPHGYDLGPDDWLLRDGVVTPGGERLGYAQCPRTGCPAGSRTFDVYHSAGQLWPTQWVQAALMLALTAAVLLLAHRALRLTTRLH